MAVKEKVFTTSEINNMEKHIREFFFNCLENKTYNLIGINWHEWVEVEDKMDSGVIKFKWE